MSFRKVALTLYLRQMAAPSEWTVQRSGQWWDWALCNDDRYWWRSNFRMSKDTFLFLCDKLRPYIQKQVRLNI